MANVHRRILEQKDTTVFTVSGEFRFHQVMSLIRELSSSDLTRNHLWDLSEADMVSLTAREVAQVADLCKEYSHLRPGGRSAFVASKSVTFGMARMFQIVSENRENPISYRVFRSIPDAMEWLRCDCPLSPPQHRQEECRFLDQPAIGNRTTP